MSKKTNNNHTKGVLILKQIEFNRVYHRKVSSNNKTSGKVTVPRELIGKSVYVVVDVNNVNSS